MTVPVTYRVMRAVVVLLVLALLGAAAAGLAGAGPLASFEAVTERVVDLFSELSAGGVWE
jgi:hypothetical protein